jgi:signal transduction histidine kinase
VALEKIMLLREARAGERRARGLYELGRALTFGLEPESMLERLCRQASAAFGATSAHIWLLDAQGMLSVAAQHGNPAELAAAVGRLRIPTDAVSLAAVAVRTGESQLVLDAETDPRVNRTLYELLRWRSLIGAPLLSQGKAIGALMLGHPEPERFSRDDLNSATTITAQAAVAYSHARVYAALQQTSLQNARLLKEARDNERRARALYDIARALTSSLEPKPLLEELCRQAARSFQATAAVIMLREPNGDLTVTAHHGYTGAQAETVSRVRIPAGVSSVATVALQAREAQVVVDALTDSRVSSQLREVFGTRSLLLAPLESQGNVTGVMALVHAEPGKFSLEDREVAATLASQAAAAISHAQLYAELQHRQRITAIEARIAKAAGATLHLDEVMAAVCREAVDALEVGRVSMWLADAPGWLRRVAEAGIPGPTTAPTRLAYDGTLDDPAGFGKGRLRKDRTEPLSMEALELARRYQVADSISIPLGAAGKFMGVLVVMDLQQPDRFSTRDVELAEAVGRHAQLALANALAYRRQEEALTRLDELNRTRTGFLATMRHELRTPLNSIIGFTELLQNELTGGLNPKQARYVANVREAGAQLLQLIEDILEFVAVQGSDDMVRETFDAGLLVTELSGTMAPRAKLRGLALDSETPETVVPIVGDRLRLNRALRHLLENAIKFTDAGGSVRITARVEDALVIQVVDSGIGIPLEDQERIFEPFVQGDSSKTRRYAGTGLGLAIARRIIELHGGSLTLQSAPGAGSTFTLRLPIATAESAGRVVA